MSQLTLGAGSKTVLERLKSISVSTATAVEKHLAPSDFVIKIPLVLNVTQHVNFTVQNIRITRAHVGAPIEQSFIIYFLHYDNNISD